MDRLCAQCSATFEITDDDLAFYDTASPVFNGKKESIPPPTHCPLCRHQRRMAWRNERSLYMRVCELCKRSKVSAISPQSELHTACRDCLYSDVWDPMEKGRPYDFGKSFRGNLEELMRDTPIMMLYQSGINENCEYINFAGDGCRNCYFIFNSGRDEDCYYARGLIESKDCVDMLICSEDQLCYECINCNGCYHVFFSQNCMQCSDCVFLYNCKGCRNCFGCTNLVQKEYHLFNKPCTPEQYEAAMAQLHSFEFVEKTMKEFDRMRAQSIHRATNNLNTEACTGDYLTNSKSCIDCYEVKGGEDCKYLISSKLCKDSYDLFGFGYDSELLYENTAVGLTMQAAFSFTSASIPNCYFCLYCENIQNCFACASLHHKKYCILNKQYTKEGYEELVPKIIDQARREGMWGEFLPADMSPFGYNETVGQEFFPLSQEEVRKRGWKWNTYQAPVPHAEKTIAAAALPDSIDDIPDDIMQWAIECQETAKQFRLTKQELDFYRRMRLPVPRLHPDARHYRRMSQRNPCKLWERECVQCKRVIQTTYGPDRTETVYCEECYLAAVY